MGNHDVHYAGFWTRFLAFMIDSIAASFLIAPVIFYLIGETRLEDYNLQDPQQLSELLNRMALQLSLDALLLGTIFILFWIFRSATPGKMILGCSIVDARTFGKASSWQNIIRYLGYFLSLFPAGLGFLWIAFDGRKQGWHDKLARTVVIQGRPRQAQDEPAGA